MIALDIGQLAPSRKTVKKGLELNVMVIGKNGLGKSSVINTLLNSHVLEPCSIDTSDPQHKTAIKTTTVDLDDKQSKIRLSLVQIPGFGDFLDNSHVIQPVVDFIDLQLQAFFEGESGLNRRAIVDNRIHVCLYFIAPDHRGLKTLDITFMKAVHNKVNLFPVISKADSYTNQELMEMKQRVIRDLHENEIKIYEFPECDNEDDEDFVVINNEMKKLVPFAVMGGTESVSIGGKMMRGRQYPWGFVNVDDVMNSDLVYLRKMLFRSHTHDLKDITHEIHYENYRAQILMSSGRFAPNVMESLQGVDSGRHSVDMNDSEQYSLNRSFGTGDKM